MDAEILAAAEMVGCDVMQAIAARAPSLLDEAEERVEQEGAVGIVFGDDAVALRVQVSASVSGREEPA